jgi:hypothetical protein
MTELVGILILAVAVEAIVEFFIAPAVKPDKTPAVVPEEGAMQAVVEPGIDWRSMALRWSAAVIAVLLCIAYQADALDMAGLASPIPIVGQVVTGLLIGRGSNFINDFAGRWLGKNPLTGND